MANRVFVQSEFLTETAVLGLADNAPDDAVRSAVLSALPEQARKPDLIVISEDDRSMEDPDESEAAATRVRGPVRHFHVGRCKRITVKVRYAGRAESRGFSPAATIERIRAWAIRKFTIDSKDAAELVLQLAGSEAQPPADKHVGCFADKHCSVVFDLVRSYTVNGDAAVKPDHAALLAHLQGGAFLLGEEKRRWKLRCVDWPHVFVDVCARSGEMFTLKLRCDGYPSLAPTGAFWDAANQSTLPPLNWPRAGSHRGQALRSDWQNGHALYIPCDRQSITGHDQWTQLYPAWLWCPRTGLTRYLDVVWQLLNGDDYLSPNA